MSTFETQVGGNHYRRMAIQPTEYIHKNKLGWCEGNVVKYISRHQFKNGKEDVLKARDYIDKLLELAYGEEKKDAHPEE